MSSRACLLPSLIPSTFRIITSTRNGKWRVFIRILVLEMWVLQVFPQVRWGSTKCCIQGPKRASVSGRLSNITIDVYEEIISWRRPCVDLDMDWDSQQTIFPRLACVCRLCLLRHLRNVLLLTFREAKNGFQTPRRQQGLGALALSNALNQWKHYGSK